MSEDTTPHEPMIPDATPEGDVFTSTRANGKHDVWSHRMVLGGLVGTVLLCVIGAVVLDAVGRPIPHFLTTVGGAAVMACVNLAQAIMKQGDA